MDTGDINTRCEYNLVKIIYHIYIESVYEMHFNARCKKPLCSGSILFAQVSIGTENVLIIYTDAKNLHCITVDYFA